jgi:hypothetical protein
MVYDEDDDFDDPEPDVDDDDSPELLACPHCGEQIYEEADQCPHCGDYITHSTSPLAGRSIWFIVLGVAGIVATIVALMHS